jgi:UDPglucose 6-dehydrogenase
VIARNERQIDLVVDAVMSATAGQTVPIVALWGVSFKPNTDDIREAPSLKIAERLLDRGCLVRLADPVVSKAQVDSAIGTSRVTFTDIELDAAEGADVVMLVTEWRQYRSPDFSELRQSMRGTTVIDGRNQWSQKQVQSAGLTYIGIGRR